MLLRASVSHETIVCDECVHDSGGMGDEGDLGRAELVHPFLELLQIVVGNGRRRLANRLVKVFVRDRQVEFVLRQRANLVRV